MDTKEFEAIVQFLKTRRHDISLSPTMIASETIRSLLQSMILN